MSISATTFSVLRHAVLVAFAGICLLPGVLSADLTNPVPDCVVSRFRIGPLFEHSVARDGGTFWAVRPFYAKVRDPAGDAQVTDAVWPLSTFHYLHEQLWWRVLLAYGSDLDVHREDAAWSLAILPFYFRGRTRQGEDYAALFPVYGHHPHFLLMDDIDFTFFPGYFDYRVHGVEREYYLWPIFSHMGESDVKRTGVFPVYGKVERRGERHTFCFWPFWTSAEYGGDGNPGRSRMLFPLYGKVDREKEYQRLYLPPFFSYARTDGAERWRMPWPFYETATSATVRKRSYWPFYGDVNRSDEHRWYAVWPLIESFTLTSKGRRTERSRFFPFYVGETVYERDASGGEKVKETYTRWWPFFSRESDRDGSRLRVLELSLIRYSGGIERNWAPFWTFYERTERNNEVTRDGLWGLFSRRTERMTGAEGEREP